MTQPTAYRPKKPGRSAIEAQVEKLCRHELLQGEKRGELLKYLVRIQREGRYEHPYSDQKPSPTGKRILFEFYKHWARNNGERDQWPTPEDSEEAGKKLIGELAEALDRYYKFVDDTLIVRISRGRGEGYEPDYSWRAEQVPVALIPKTALADPEEPVDCTYIGNNNAGVEYVIRRLRSSPDEEPRLMAIRDTHVRHQRLIQDHVRYAGIDAAFSEFLMRSNPETTVATMILGWDIDREYVRAMVGTAMMGQANQLKCFRLPRPTPLLNFILLDYSDLTTEVLYGWGQGKPGRPGAVFRSKDPRLVDEFNEFFHQLLGHAELVTFQRLLEAGPDGDAASAYPGLTLEGR